MAKACPPTILAFGFQAMTPSVPTFCRAIFTDILDFCARVLAIQGGTGRRSTARLIPDTVLPSTRGTSRGPVLLASPQGARAREAVGERWSALGHAAALRDGHLSQDANRLASARARRAAAARDLRSVGTASPVPKYISSGVCPRNAECGGRWLCSWT